MAIQLSEEIKTLLRGPNFAHLATVMADGAPHVAAVWVDLDGDLILVGTGQGSVKARNTARDARVALSIVAFDQPYTEAQIRGRVVERRPDASFLVMDRIARKYTRADFPWRDNPAGRLVLVIEPERARYSVLPLTHEPMAP
jgi:PPOX class probable F420-dependent enzyme